LRLELPAASVRATPARLAFLVRDLGLGGVGRSTLRLARHFVERGVAVDLILEKDKGPLRSLIPEGVGVTVLDTSEPYWRTKLMMLRADPAGIAHLYPAVIRPRRPLGSYLRLPLLVR
jgi:hypothetical protein